MLQVSHLASDIPAGFAKGFNPVSKFSSFTHQKPGFFPHNGVNYRPNSRPWNGNGNEKYKLREKPNRNGHLEASSEQTCGPRARNRNSRLNLAAEKEEMGLLVQRDQYNLPDFRTEYENVKFYVIKSFSEDDIHKSIKYNVWASTPNGNKKLDAAFQEAETKANETGTELPIFLFFSVSFIVNLRLKRANNINMCGVLRRYVLTTIFKGKNLVLRKRGILWPLGIKFIWELNLESNFLCILYYFSKYYRVLH